MVLTSAAYREKSDRLKPVLQELARSCLREKYAEAGAFGGVCVQTNRAAMIVHNLGHDGKSQPHSLFLRCEKWIEDLLAQFGRYTRAGIFDGYANARFAI